MTDLNNLEAPDYVSEEDEQYIRELFASFNGPEEEMLRRMNVRDQAIARFLLEHKQEEIAIAQGEAIGYLWTGRKFH